MKYAYGILLTTRLATMLSKDSIAVDILSFGEMSDNHSLLEEFISKVNIDDNSHLYEVTPSQDLLDVLIPAKTREGKC